MVQEGHIKIKVRREMLLQDAMDAVESIDPVDMRKVPLSHPPLSLSAYTPALISLSSLHSLRYISFSRLVRFKTRS
jgi:hypothetical protein